MVALDPWTIRAALVALAAVFPGSGAAQPGGATEAPADLLAAQLRMQGFQCDAPATAERDVARSSPNEAVWVLRCANATYRMRVVPDMAAHVERLSP
jgi:hypothetical protein